jgi:hypothetical protein
MRAMDFRDSFSLYHVVLARVFLGMMATLAHDAH